VRPAWAIVGVCLLAGGCAAYTERRALGYGDYVGFSCEQLGQEAVRLMRVTASRSEHILSDDQTRRDTAMRQLKAVKKASVDKGC
jgi:hypothetical protein